MDADRHDNVHLINNTHHENLSYQNFQPGSQFELSETSSIAPSEHFIHPGGMRSFQRPPNQYSSNHLPNGRLKRHRIGRTDIVNLFHSWWLHALGCIGILGVLTSLYILLSKYNNKPQPEWPESISVNTVVSILVICLKVLEFWILTEGIGQMKFSWFLKPRPISDLDRFNDGSRGEVFASLRLLWITRGRQLGTSVGAFVLITGVLVGPFSQQLIGYYTCFQQSKTIRAHVTRSIMYANTGNNSTAQGFPLTALDYQRTVNAGIYRPDTTGNPSVKVSCPTGNCAFPRFSTQGVCSSCEDVSSRVKNHTFGSLHTYYSPCNVSVSGQSGTDTYTAFSIGNCKNVSQPESIHKSDERYWDAIGYSSDLKPECKDVTRSYQAGNCISSVRCKLYPCVRTIDSRVENGVLKENVTSSRPSLFLQEAGKPNVDGIIDLKCLNNSQPGSTISHLNTLPNDPDWAFLDASADAVHISQCIYRFDHLGWEAIGQFLLRNVLNSAVLEKGDVSDGPTLNQILYNGASWDVTSLSKVFEGIADSSTGYIRQNAVPLPNFSQDIEAWATEADTCLTVRWPWFVAPLLSGLLTILFFGLTLYHLFILGGWRYTWKNSLVAILFRGLEPEKRAGAFGEDGHPPEKSMTLIQIRREAQKRNAHFMLIDGTWRFVETGSR